MYILLLQYYNTIWYLYVCTKVIIISWLYYVMRSAFIIIMLFDVDRAGGEGV